MWLQGFFFIFLLSILGGNGSIDSKPMEGLSCRPISDSHQMCTGKNEEYTIGFVNVREIATSKFKSRKHKIKECNETVCLRHREVVLPTLLHDSYGRLRFIFQDEENAITQSIHISTCSSSCGNSTCKPAYTTYELVSWDPFYNYFDPQFGVFTIPYCCDCKPNKPEATTSK